MCKQQYQDWLLVALVVVNVIERLVDYFHPDNILVVRLVDVGSVKYDTEPVKTTM
jgi:hypothetical protein